MKFSPSIRTRRQEIQRRRNRGEQNPFSTLSSSPGTTRPRNVVVVDINALFKNLSANGIVVGGKKLTTGFLGGLFSLDGVHPSNTGYAILANETIHAINNQFGTKIPLIVLETVPDPLR